jgi:hypothetical protein
LARDFSISRPDWKQRSSPRPTPTEAAVIALEMAELIDKYEGYDRRN